MHLSCEERTLEGETQFCLTAVHPLVKQRLEVCLTGLPIETIRPSPDA